LLLRYSLIHFWRPCVAASIFLTRATDVVVETLIVAVSVVLVGIVR
jgi:hypothetical protein